MNAPDFANDTERFWWWAHRQVDQIDRWMVVAEDEARRELATRHGGIYASMTPVRAR